MKKLKNYDEIPTFVDVDTLYNAQLGKCMGYVLEKNLSEEEKKEFLKKYSNVLFTTRQYRYAPELKETVLVVFPKKISTLQQNRIRKE